MAEFYSGIANAVLFVAAIPKNRRAAYFQDNACRDT